MLSDSELYLEAMKDLHEKYGEGPGVWLGEIALRKCSVLKEKLASSLDGIEARMKDVRAKLDNWDFSGLNELGELAQQAQAADLMAARLSTHGQILDVLRKGR